MDSDATDNDVYGLISKLCESLFRKNYQKEDNPYLPQQDNEKHLRRLKSKAYEIILNKSTQDYGKVEEPCDPIIELLKHAFVLKVKAGRVSQAAELERYLDEFIDNQLEPDSVTYQTLQFLNCLKSLDFEDDESLDVFYYGKPHPQLPEMLSTTYEISPFQIYPSEAFYLPEKFERKFKQENLIGYGANEPGSNLPLLSRFLSSEANIQHRPEKTDTTLSSIPRRTVSLLNGMSTALSTYFVPQIKDVSAEEDNDICREGIVTEPESPWQCYDTMQWFTINGRVAFDNQTEICEIEEDIKVHIENVDKIWENMDKVSPVSDHRTWETLGVFNPPPEPPFVSESVEATEHLINVAQDFLLNQNDIQKITEVPIKEFLNNAKLMLLGVESSTFIFRSVSGFELKKNVSIHGISSITLENLCYEIAHWGSCFRNLSDLSVPNPETGKLKINGLIFKALCRSIKEFLLFYHAAILRTSVTDDTNTGLLKFLNKVRPLGQLILKVAELCRCDGQNLTSLGEGMGILTHIYREVTKVTERNIALVFYSLLKDCCEVYFRFLQQWIFEGICVDIYDEFMIKVQPQYLRTRGHRFWTRAFSINKNSVPGFLSVLTDSILQCGKAVALLKICNPMHPLCRLSISSSPQVRVCLSVSMLREQTKFYEEYVDTCKMEQGDEVTMHLAIQDRKEEEKKRAELVIAAQQDTLKRLKKEREDELTKIAIEKNKLLKQLKEQAEEVAQRKEKERDAELLADKLLLEKILKEEEEAKNAEKEERKNTLKYYNDLAEECKKRQIHAEWRIRRMKLFDERVTTMASVRREYATTPDTDIYLEKTIENIQEASVKNNNMVEVKESPDATDSKENEKVSEENVESQSAIVNMVEGEEALSEDENSNPTSTKTVTSASTVNVSTINEENKKASVSNEQNQNTSEGKETTKAIRPTVLELTGTNSQKYCERPENLRADQNASADRTIDLLKLNATDNMTAAQRNRLKVLQQEYGFTPNNNESATILTALENSETKIDLTEIEMNRLRNTRHLTGFDWDEVETEKKRQTDEQNNEEKTEIQLNRLRNTRHMTHLNWNEHDAKAISYKNPLTEAEVNRNKVMSTFYNRTDDAEFAPRRTTDKLTDCQKNRNRNMAHSTEQFDFDLPSTKVDHEHFKETPMSTNTDHFTVSTHSSSSSNHVHSCENTPFSETYNHSDVLYARSSDGMSTDEASQTRCSKYFQDTPAFPNFIGFGSIPNTPTTETQELTIADVEMISTTSLQVYLEKSVLIPLTAQSCLVNGAVIKCLLNEHNMLSHLHSMRSYFFLLNGEFAKTLMQSLFTRLYESSAPVELFSSSTLTNFLEKALISSLSSTYANSELLSLFVETEIPAILQTSNPEILSCLSLNYKLSWPLNIIFHDIVVLQYNKVFKFLLMVGRVLWVLQEDFHTLKTERKESITKNHHKLQLYRHSMMQFINALHTYLTCCVLHASWSEFEKELECAKTLDEVYDTHVKYIKRILSRCMLNVRGEKMRTCLNNIFKIILKFHNRIRAQNWNDPKSASPNYENLEKMYVNFCEQRAYLVRVAEKLANSGYQPHLLQFLHALNINSRYDLTPKKQ